MSLFWRQGVQSGSEGGEGRVAVALDDLVCAAPAGLGQEGLGRQADPVSGRPLVAHPFGLQQGLLGQAVEDGHHRGVREVWHALSHVAHDERFDHAPGPRFAHDACL